ncbi:MAG: hypothetical protein ACRD2J_17400 [Thermoanaerobaculia bacterium]
MDARSRRLTLAAPAMTIAAILLTAVPILHPNNTCKDWLEKWGQLHELPLWLPSHQLATLGFAIAAGTFLMLPYLGRISRTGILASTMLGMGLAAQGMLVLLHATAVSTLGTAFNAAPDEATREMYRVIATAIVNYDVGLSGVASVLMSGGMIVYAIYLRRLGWMSTAMAVVLAGLGSIWAAQYFGLHRIVGVPTSEWLPYISLALWIECIALILLLRVQREKPVPALSTEPAAT